MPMMAVICGMPIADMTALLRKTRPKSSVSGKTSSWSGKKTPAESKVNCGNSVFDGHVLGANDFLRGHGKKRAGFYGGVIRDHHERTPANFREASHRSRARRAAPLFIHFVSGVNSQFKKLGTGVEQFGDAFACGQAPLFVLRFDGLRAAALADLFFLVLA